MSDFWCIGIYCIPHYLWRLVLRSIPKGEQGPFQQALGNGSGPVTWAAPPFIEALKDASWYARRVPRTFRRFKLGLFWHLQKPSWKVPLKGAGDFQWPDLARWHHFRMCGDFTAAFFSQQGSWMPPRLATTRPARLAPSWDHWPDLDQWKSARLSNQLCTDMRLNMFKFIQQGSQLIAESCVSKPCWTNTLPELFTPQASRHR